MPVGTAATVKGLTQGALEELGAGIILANTYHLYLRPGHELIRKLGGLHRFMSWPRAILTDSGGFQVFSLSELRKITDDGVRFRSHLDGSEHLLTPEKAVEIQMALGSDIAMVLDECIETPAPRDVAESAVKRTTLWARRARSYFLKNAGQNGDAALAQWQFGIVQGATFADLRRESARQLLEMNFPGYAVGGLAVGEPHALTCEMTGEVTALLPKDRAALLDGRRAAGTTRRLRFVGDRHDGLRAAHARGAARLHLHQRRSRADQERAVCARSAAARSGLLLRGLQALYARVFAALICRGRDHRGNSGDPP